MKKILIASMLILFFAGVGFAADPSDLADKCRQRCEKSGKTGIDLRDCIRECNKIENCGPEFKRCIKNAKTEKQREACQKGYRKCKGE